MHGQLGCDLPLDGLGIPNLEKMVMSLWLEWVDNTKPWIGLANHAMKMIEISLRRLPYRRSETLRRQNFGPHHG
jgi:hypothetical protein